MRPMRDQLRIGSGLSWVVAWVLAVLGPAWYLLDSSTMTWWLGVAMVLPLIGLAAWRSDRKGFDGTANTGDPGGPWAAP